MAAREVIPVGLLLLTLGALVYVHHITHGSFYYDDWATAAFVKLPPHPGYLGALQYYFSLFGFRPLVALYIPTLHEVLGLHQHWQIAWGVFLAVVASVTLYATLRTLRLERLHAFLISALVLVFPFADSAVMWPTEATAHLVLAIYLAGLMLAVRGLRTPDMKRARLYHLGSLVLYLAAITTYEIVATVALASVLVYVWQSDWRRAARRFAVDVVVIAAALIWTGSHTSIDQVTSTGGGVHHAVQILGQGLYIVAQTIVPFGAPNHVLVVCLASAVFVACWLLWFRFLRGTSAGADVRRWLMIAAGGVVWAFVAWAIFVPADPYYEPTTLGVGNRTNIVAAIGLVAAVYGLAMAVGTLLFSRWRWRMPAVAAVALAAAVVLGTGYIHRVAGDDTQWDRASRYQQQVLSTVKRDIPRPVKGAIIYAYGFPLFTAPGVPTFAATWDLNGAVQVTYDDASIRAYPAAAPAYMLCAPHSVYPTAAGYGPQYGALYGQAYVVDVSTGRASRPLNLAECSAALRR